MAHTISKEVTAYTLAKLTTDLTANVMSRQRQAAAPGVTIRSTQARLNIARQRENFALRQLKR